MVPGRGLLILLPPVSFLQHLKPHAKLTGKAHFICCAVSCRIATCGWTTILCLIETGPLRLLRSAHYRFALFASLYSSQLPRCTLRSSALHVSHDSWALSDPHVSSPARCEAIMGSPLSMLASHNCDILLHFSSAFEIRILCTYCLLSSLPSTWSVSAFEFRSS